MRTILPTFAGLVALAAVSAQTATVPSQGDRGRARRLPGDRAGAPRIGGVGTAAGGGTAGATGIGVAAIRTGDFAPRCDPAHSVDDTNWSNLAPDLGLRNSCLGDRVRHGIPKRGEGRHYRRRY